MNLRSAARSSPNAGTDEGCAGDAAVGIGVHDGPAPAALAAPTQLVLDGGVALFVGGIGGSSVLAVVPRQTTGPSREFANEIPSLRVRCQREQETGVIVRVTILTWVGPQSFADLQRRNCHEVRIDKWG